MPNDNPYLSKYWTLKKVTFYPSEKPLKPSDMSQKAFREQILSQIGLKCRIVRSYVNFYNPYEKAVFDLHLANGVVYSSYIYIDQIPEIKETIEEYMKNRGNKAKLKSFQNYLS